MKQTPPRIARLAVAALVVAFLPACLSQSLRIPREDLAELATRPPAERGAAVRVIQRTSFSEDPPAASAFAPSTPPAPPMGFYAPRPFGLFVHHHAPVYTYQPSPTVVITPDSAGQPATFGSGPATSGPSGAGVGRGAAGAAGSAVKDDKAGAALLVAAAVTAFAIVATTEAMRYDGWASVHPAHPLHLRGYGGGWKTTTLAALTPEDAARADEAVLEPGEGGLHFLGRAPLDREGWVMRLALGSAGVPVSTKRNEHGVGWDIQIGYYLSNWLGLVGSQQFVFGTASDKLETYASRSTIEVQALPIHGWRLHAGGFGGFGFGYVSWGGGGGIPDGKWDGLSSQAGVMAELEVVTRIAITARYGWVWDGPSHREVSAPSFFTVGFAAY